MSGWSQAQVDARFYALVADLAGAPQEIIDPATGQVEGRVAQSLYGKRTWAGGVSSPLLFAGQYEDAESGWVYNRFRFYQPLLGSYNAQDPLGLAPRVASGQGYVDHAAFWVDVMGLASHVKNKQLQRQIDALTPQQKGALGESIAKDKFAGQFDKANPRSSYKGISGKTRITDITLRDESIVEAKFVKKQGLTTQLKDGIAQAQADKAAYHLVTASETKLSGPLQTAIAEGQVVHHTMSESAIAQTITTL